MSYEFELPDPGEGLTEAEIEEWHVEEGDEVEEDDVLAEVETDKAVTDVPSPVDGTVDEITVEAGETADVGEVIVVFDTGEEDEEETTEGEDESAGEAEAEEETEESESEDGEEAETEEEGE